jgi:hypothetical protein
MCSYDEQVASEDVEKRELKDDRLGDAIWRAAALPSTSVQLVKLAVEEAFPQGAHAVVAAGLNGTDGAFVIAGDALSFVGRVDTDAIEVVRVPPLPGGLLRTRYLFAGDSQIPETKLTASYTHPHGTISIDENQYGKAAPLLAFLAEWQAATSRP